MAFTHTKKVYMGSFLKARIRIRSHKSGSGSRSDQKGPDPTGSGSATLQRALCHTAMEVLQGEQGTVYQPLIQPRGPTSAKI
jgi:hypothetical protein